ncbi:hypothetical protein P7K49_034755 [Saguinus oedipus]|uniref:Uncharacterized protein n=1 Tax=Saguinus oedipus TaxID=9490 RepID=A0ABQ9TVM0_SAGOE|nr:hypothetical protein P7K49_034755 [Saguinus oedipus]
MQADAHPRSQVPDHADCEGQRSHAGLWTWAPQAATESCDGRSSPRSDLRSP